MPRRMKTFKADMVKFRSIKYVLYVFIFLILKLGLLYPVYCIITNKIVCVYNV